MLRNTLLASAALCLAAIPVADAVTISEECVAPSIVAYQSESTEVRRSTLPLTRAVPGTIRVDYVLWRINVTDLFAGDILDISAQLNVNNRLGRDVQLGHYIAVTELTDTLEDLNGDRRGHADVLPLGFVSAECTAGTSWCLRELSGHHVVQQDGDYKIELVGVAGIPQQSGDALTVSRIGGLSVLVHTCT